MDAVFGDEAVDDVEDGVAVVGVEGVELVDAVCDGGVGVRGWPGTSSRSRWSQVTLRAWVMRMRASRLGVILPFS